MRDQPTLLADDERIALVADADPVDHPPQLFQRDFADDPAGLLLGPRQADRDGRRRAAGRRRASAARCRACPVVAAPRSGTDSRVAPTALVASGAPLRSKIVISRNSGNSRTVVLEDPILLPGARSVALSSVPTDCSTRVLCCMYMPICSAPAWRPCGCRRDGRLGAAAQRADRDEAEDHQRQDRRGRDQQDESRGNPSHRAACCAAAGRHFHTLPKMSRSASNATSNFVDTARDVICQARNAAGGSS